MKKLNRIILNVATSACAVFLFDYAIAEDSIRLANTNEQIIVKSTDSSTTFIPVTTTSLPAAILEKNCATPTAIHQLKKDIREQLINEYRGFENMSISYKPISNLDTLNNIIRYHLDFELMIEPIKTASSIPIRWECKQGYLMKTSSTGECKFILDSIETIDLLQR
jgi:hypothetical protein